MNGRAAGVGEEGGLNWGGCPLEVVTVGLFKFERLSVVALQE